VDAGIAVVLWLPAAAIMMRNLLINSFGLLEAPDMAEQVNSGPIAGCCLEMDHAIELALLPWHGSVLIRMCCGRAPHRSDCAMRWASPAWRTYVCLAFHRTA
jgi:hypothetical protein